MPLSRKHFISATAFGLSTAAYGGFTTVAQGAVERTPVHFHVLTAAEYDKAAMLAKLTIENPHKQVFQSISPIILAPGIASIYIHMQNSLNAYQFSLGLGQLATLGVLIGPSVVFGLNDAMWKKYNFSQTISKDLAGTNIYYEASSNLDLSAAPDDPNGIYQDWSAQAVVKRGGQFFVCHNAMTAVAGLVAMKTSGDPKTVLTDWEKNLVPGFQIVPAGVAAVQEAQENDWKLFPVIA